jgi:hypothetical protein
MSDQDQSVQKSGDGLSDAMAATALIVLAVGTLVYWLSGFPS